jgi:hypothetical protein
MEEIEQTKQENEIEKDSDEIDELEEKKLPKSILLIKMFVMSLIGITLILAVFPYFLNNTDLKFRIEEKVSKILDVNFSVKGDVSVSFLPLPSITMEDVILKNYAIKTKDGKVKIIYNFYAKLVKADVINLMFGGTKIRKIKILDPVIESYYGDELQGGRENDFTRILEQFTGENSLNDENKNLNIGLSSKLFSIENFNAEKFKLENFPKITLENGKLIRYGEDSYIPREFIKIDANLKVRPKKFEASGNFTSEELVSNFNIFFDLENISKKTSSFFYISSPVLDLRIDGNFISNKKLFLENNFKGNLTAEISNLNYFYRSYINNSGVIYRKIKPTTKAVKISSIIESEGQIFSADNVKIDSDLISGKASMKLDLSKQFPIIDINLVLDNIDLDSIWSADNKIEKKGNEDQNKKESDEKNIDLLKTKPEEITKKESDQDLNNQIKDENFNQENQEQSDKKIEPIDFEYVAQIRDFYLSAEVKIINAKYLGAQLKDIDLYLTISKKGQILILPLIIRIPGEGIFRMNGVLDNNPNYPKFVGKFDASGKNLSEIFKWFKIESQNLRFDSLKDYSIYSDLMINLDIIALSNFYLNLNLGDNEFLGEIKINNEKTIPTIISNFKIREFKIDDYFLTSGQNTYLSPGSLLKKTLWLNNIFSNNDLKINFEKLIYKNKEFVDQDINLRFGQGYLEVNDLSLVSQSGDLRLNLLLDISDNNPKFELKLGGNNFIYDTIVRGEPNIEGNNVSKIFDNFFALPSLEQFKGKIILDFAKINLDGFEIEKVKIGGILKDGIVNLSEASCNFFDGNFDYKGTIGLKDNKIINGNILFNNVSMGKFLDQLFSINNIQGVMNLSASITSVASRKENFIRELISEIKFNSQSPYIERYGMNDLIKKMFSPSQYQNELQNPDKILFNSIAKTFLQKASGSFQIAPNMENKFRIDFNGTAFNGIMSGKLALPNSTIDANVNVIFLTGNSKKQFPINIVSNLKGKFDDIDQKTNFDQVKQYLINIKTGKVNAQSNSEANIKNNQMQQFPITPEARIREITKSQ